MRLDNPCSEKNSENGTGGKRLMKQLNQFVWFNQGNNIHMNINCEIDFAEEERKPCSVALKSPMHLSIF